MEENWKKKENWKCRKYVLQRVKESGFALIPAPSRFRDDREIVTIAVKKNGMALKHVSERLRDDYTIVCLALENNSHSIQYVSERLKNDKSFILYAIKTFNIQVHHLDSHWFSNKEVIYRLICIEGQYICYASFNLENHKKMIKKAIKNNTNAFFKISWVMYNIKMVLKMIHHLNLSQVKITILGSPHGIIYDTLNTIIDKNIKLNRSISMAMYRFTSFHSPLPMYR